MSTFDDQLTRMKTGKGFIAALDNSGGSTPGVLTNYGIAEREYDGEEEMFKLIHEMRTRIITSPAFTGERIVASILYEDTFRREIDGKRTAVHLWEEKNIVPILKIDQGLMEEQDGARLMKDMPELDALLAEAKEEPVFGTKMRSVVASANPVGVEACVAQQFAYAKQICAAGFVPIIEPEVDIHAADKAEAEEMLHEVLAKHLETLAPEELVMFKLTPPEKANLYKDFMSHPNMVRVVALSGGYSREEAVRRVAENEGLIASFNRGLSEGLTAQQTDEEFNAILDQSIEMIYQASIT